MAENFDVITAGETMVLGVPPRPGRLRHTTGLELKIGGAESNLAIALSRLGLSAGWASYLGDDEMGQLVLDRTRRRCRHITGGQGERPSDRTIPAGAGGH